jgi:hypothetical protein
MVEHKPGRSKAFSSNPSTTRKGWECSTVVKCLPSMHKTLGSIPNTEKKIENAGKMQI